MKTNSFTRTVAIVLALGYVLGIANASMAQSPLPASPETVQKADDIQPEASPEATTPDQQEAPGAKEFYRSQTGPLPDYFFRSYYYNTWGLGARPLADYAPAGYEARPWQDAPGVPEFSPLPTPAPITSEERQKFVVRGMVPGSFLVPYTNTSFRLRGFVRATGLYDFQPIGSRDDFVTATIPVPQESGQNANISARYSRFAIETFTPTTFHDWTMHSFIEGDFFNGPSQAVGGGGNPFRLRFAFVDFGYFRVGQQNTVFMDSNAFPSTVDFAGPRGLVNQRRPGARVTIPICDGLYWAGGIEQPFSDITTDGEGIRVQDIPDGATHIRYEADNGHVQLSGLVRSIGYRPLPGADVSRRAGMGGSVSTVFHPWAILMHRDAVRDQDPSGLERSRVLLQYTCGWGIARYIQDTAGLGLDGQVDPVTGNFDTLYAVGWSASYEHWFNAHWLTNITYSADYTGVGPNQPGRTYAGAKYLATSLWWIPIRGMSLGMEYVWGERRDYDDQRGRAQRLNALVQYNF